MNKVNNPYEKALDGLVINDPVTSFFNFCKEREKIRLEREIGEEPPIDGDGPRRDGGCAGLQATPVGGGVGKA